MFSGIVETTSAITKWEPFRGLFLLQVGRPQQFDDIKLGDSICTNGVCLTIEKFDDNIIQFAVGNETLKITEWDKIFKSGQELNLERSLRLGDRIHGHLVTGHVDSKAKVVDIKNLEGCLEVSVRLSEKTPLVWKKGSVCINGVSLTVNSFQEGVITVCLVPETLKKTNLSVLKINDFVNIEYDYFAKAQLAFTKGEHFASHQ